MEASGIYRFYEGTFYGMRRCNGRLSTMIIHGTF
jgi:hypothetical protein